MFKSDNISILLFALSAFISVVLIIIVWALKEDPARVQALSAVLSALVTFLALLITFWVGWITREAAKAAQRTADIAQDQTKVAQESLEHQKRLLDLEQQHSLLAFVSPTYTLNLVNLSRSPIFIEEVAVINGSYIPALIQVSARGAFDNADFSRLNQTILTAGGYIEFEIFTQDILSISQQDLSSGLVRRGFDAVTHKIIRIRYFYGPLGQRVQEVIFEVRNKSIVKLSAPP